jgi:hypothetical protein
MGRSTRRSARVAAALAAPLAVVLLAGCGGGGDVLDATGAPTEAVAATATPAFLAQAAERTAAVETGTVEAEITADGQTVTVTGQFDTSGPSGSATVTTSGGPGADVVFSDGVLYVKPQGLDGFLGSADKPWLKFDLAAQGDLAGLLPDGVTLPSIEPQQLLDDLRAEGIEVTEVGSEDVRGVATTRYAVTVPADATARAGIDGASGDVWVDADGLVRRIELRTDGAHAFTVHAELFDLGQPVTITVPSADQVTDLGQLGELFGAKPR